MFLCSSIIGAFVFFFFSSYDFIIQSWLCWPTAILVHFFFLANFAWCFCVAFNFYQMIVRRNRESEDLEKWSAPHLTLTPRPAHPAGPLGITSALGCCQPSSWSSWRRSGTMAASAAPRTAARLRPSPG